MICLLVNFLYAFTDSLKEHTAGSQCLHAFGRLKVAISSFNAIVPLSKGVNGTDYLLKLSLIISIVGEDCDSIFVDLLAEKWADIAVFLNQIYVTAED